MSRLRAALTQKLLAPLEDVREELGELWKAEISEAVEDLAELTLVKLTAADPLEQQAADRELVHARARVANWTYVGADQVRERLKQGLHETADLLGQVLKGILK